MMLSKPLVSFIAAFAVVTGVSAAATPMARVGSQCNVGTVSCCGATLAQSDPRTAPLAALLGIRLGPGDLLGLNCLPVILMNSPW